MKAALATAVLLSTTAFAQAGPRGHDSVCLQASFAGRVAGGQRFTQALGNGLALHLDPLQNDWGWQLTVSPERGNDDWAYPVNPPLRSGNSEYLATGYGESVREVLSYTHEIRFPLTNADYSRIFKLATAALWPHYAKQPDKASAAYLDALKTLNTGAVFLSPLDYDKGGPPESVGWMRFDTVVIVPQGFQGDTGLEWSTGSCSTKRFGKKLPADVRMTEPLAF